MAKKTKMPPCGAYDSTENAMMSAPVTAPPAIIDGMTRSGSAAANGIAPSVMKLAPSRNAARPFSFSASLNNFARTTVARPSASGGTMPAAMTAAMILSEAGLSIASPAVANV